MIDVRHNPDVITCLANLSTDEVFTPPNVVNQMLNALPKKIFSNPETRFLDPATKSGVFLREIAKRLDQNLVEIIPSKKERLNHIFTKQLFGVALTELTALLARRSLYCSKFANGKYSICDDFVDPSGNIAFERNNHIWEKGRCLICGANQDQYDRGLEMENHAYGFIHDDKYRNNGKMQFDVIIGNPPYHISDSGDSTGSSPVYQHFVEQSIKLNPKYVCMIIPARWYAGGKGLDKFRDQMLSDKRISNLTDYPITADVFPGLKVIGGVCYFLWDRDYEGLCSVNTRMKQIDDKMSRSLNEFDTFVRFNKGIAILQKVQKVQEKNNIGNLGTSVSTQKPFGLRTFERPTDDGEVYLYANRSKGLIQKEKITKNQHLIGKWKVFLSMAYGEGGETREYPRMIIGKPIVAAPPSACTETYLVIDSFDGKKKAENLSAFLTTKFARFLVGLRKNTQHITSDRFAFVPKLPMDKKWDDQELQKYFGLTTEEISFIDLLVRPMEDTDA